MPTAAEIAEAVWSAKIKDPVNGEMVTARTLLARTRTVGTQARDAARQAAANTSGHDSLALDAHEAPNPDAWHDDADVELDDAGRCRE